MKRSRSVSKLFRRRFIYAFLILFPPWIRGQYIAEVLEYIPAPGQYINSLPWGSPVSASSLQGGVSGGLSLGAFGGSVVFRFEDPVENDPENPYGIDFTIFGNATSEWSEPGVVWVMEDTNGNGVPDDTWYELAGSDYYFSTGRREYGVRYTNPGGAEARDVPWSDTLGNSGVIRANSVHTQPYYPLKDSFPDIPADSYVLSGTWIQGAVDVDHPPLIKSLKRGFGYADNQVRGTGPDTIPDNPYTPEVEYSGGDAFDISWAVDELGAYMDLERIHFVKVQNAMLNAGGWLGEISTEITGAVDVAPDQSITGTLDQLVIEDLPAEIAMGSRQLELHSFHMGRPVDLPLIQWTSSQEWAWVDEHNILYLTGSGPLTLTAKVSGEPLLTSSVSTLVSQETGLSSGEQNISGFPVLFPNPVSNNIYLSGVEQVSLFFYGSTGILYSRVEDYSSGEAIDIGDFSPGVYLVEIRKGSSAFFLKLIKK